MKNIILCALLFQSLQSFGQEQDYATINFVVGKCVKKAAFSIYLNEKLVGVVGKDENFEYKIYSQGRIAVKILVNNWPFHGTLDVESGNTYYYELNYASFRQRNAPVDEEKGKVMFSENATTKTAEEDKSNPVGFGAKRTIPK